MVTESKLKDGLLTLGTVDGGLEVPPVPELIDISCQPTNVRVVPSHADSGEATETLCGDVLPADVTRSDALAMTAIQDFSDPAGLQAFAWDNDLVWVPFTWYPRGTAEPGYAGEVQVRAVEVGGDVNKRISVDIEWPARNVAPVAALP